MGNNIYKVYVFDFDGTLTSRDSLIAFIRYAKGNMRFFAGFMLFSPVLLLMKLRLYDNGRAKQRLFSYFFSGMKIEDFDSLCRDFARDCGDILRPKAIEYVNDKTEDGDLLMIVSASIDNWVKPFTGYFGRPMTVFGTQVEVKDGRLTGRFTTKNCYGREKTERMKAILSLRNECYIIAFGDSRGDKEMLNYADKGYYKPFR